MNKDFPHTGGLRVYFLGSGDIAVPTLAALLANSKIQFVGCGTQPDRPQGRKRKLTATAVGQYAAAHGIEADKPDSVNTADFRRRLASLQPDLILVFAFGQILTEALLDLPPLGCINIHASLLPRYRGASPVHAAILAGDKETGITIMKMTKGLDSGPVYDQRRLALNGSEDAGTLSEKLGQLAADHVCDILTAIAAGALAPQPQDEALASLARKLRKKDGLIDWTESATQIERKVRAFRPWPGAWCRLARDTRKRSKRAMKITITDAAVAPDPETHPAGTVIQADKHGWSVACGEDALEIRKLIPEGKREMSGTDFIRGFPIKLGTSLHETDHCKLREPANADCSGR